LNPLLERTAEKFAENGIGNSISPKLMEEYQALLDGIARKHAYRVGEAIDPDDLTRINAKVTTILKNMSNGIVGLKMEEGDLQRYDCFSSMVAATDHMFAMALKTLGGPDMPASFGPEIQEQIKSLAAGTEVALKRRHYNKLSTAIHFRDQRKLPAKTVKRINRQTMIKVKKNTASPREVASLVAEYQALKQRQDHHTFIWRFFHGKENEERMALLETMKASIASVLGTDVEIDKLDPMSVADTLNRKNIDSMAKEAFQEEGIAQRYYFAPESIKYAPVSDDAKETDDEILSSVETESLDNELRKSIVFENGEIDGERDVEVAPPVNEVPQKDEITLVQ
jgi:hypothetical protein